MWGTLQLPKSDNIESHMVVQHLALLTSLCIRNSAFSVDKVRSCPLYFPRNDWRAKFTRNFYRGELIDGCNNIGLMRAFWTINKTSWKIYCQNWRFWCREMQPPNTSLFFRSSKRRFVNTHAARQRRRKHSGKINRGLSTNTKSEWSHCANFLVHVCGERAKKKWTKNFENGVERETHLKFSFMSTSTY